MKTIQNDQKFKDKVPMPTSCDIFIFTDIFYKLTSSLSTNNCSKEEFKELTGNQKHWDRVEAWLWAFISVIDLISRSELNNRRVNRNTWRQRSRAFHLTWTITSCSWTSNAFDWSTVIIFYVYVSVTKISHCSASVSGAKPIIFHADHVISCSWKMFKTF